MALQDFLVYLSGAGVIAAVSWLFEYFGLFQNLEAKKKQLIFFGVCVAGALGAYSVATYVPAEVLNQVAPFFGIVAGIFSYLFIGNGFHAVTKKPEEPKPQG